MAIRETKSWSALLKTWTSSRIVLCSMPSRFQTTLLFFLTVGEKRIGFGFLLVLLETTFLVRLAVAIPTSIPLILELDVVTAM